MSYCFCNLNALTYLHFSTAISSHYQTVSIIESTYYSEGERKEIVSAEDENKKGKFCISKSIEYATRSLNTQMLKCHLAKCCMLGGNKNEFLQR